MFVDVESTFVMQTFSPATTKSADTDGRRLLCTVPLVRAQHARRLWLTVRCTYVWRRARVGVGSSELALATSISRKSEYPRFSPHKDILEIVENRWRHTRPIVADKPVIFALLSSDVHFSCIERQTGAIDRCEADRFAAIGNGKAPMDPTDNDPARV